MREHISKLESRFNFKYPFVQTKTVIDPRKLYVRVSEDEAEDLLSDPEPEPEPADDVPVAAADHQPPHSPDETPLTIDESAAKAGAEEAAQSESPAIASPQSQVPVTGPISTASEVTEKSEVPKNTPVQRSKIAQSLKKKLETQRRSLSQTIPDPEPLPVMCEADAALVAKLQADIVSLKRELETNRRNHANAMAAQKSQTDATIRGLQREKEQALQKVTESLRKEHEDTMRSVKNKQWCAHCSSIAQYYCCWNTSYCSTECQNLHWQQHMATCQQQQRPQSESGARVA